MSSTGITTEGYFIFTGTSTLNWSAVPKPTSWESLVLGRRSIRVAPPDLLEIVGWALGLADQTVRGQGSP